MGFDRAVRQVLEPDAGAGVETLAFTVLPSRFGPGA
jgi:hypothetical protein